MGACIREKPDQEVFKKPKPKTALKNPTSMLVAGALKLKQDSERSLKSRLLELWISIKKIGYSHQFHFGVKCSTCNAKHPSRRAYCLECKVHFCWPCFCSEVYNSACRKHSVAVSLRPLTVGGQELLLSGKLQSLQQTTLMKCELCKAESIGKKYCVLQSGIDDRIGCEECFKSRRAKSLWAVVLQSPLLQSPDFNQLGPMNCDTKFEKLVQLIYDCHQSGQCGLALHANSLLQHRGRLYISGSQTVECEDKLITDKTDIYRLGELVRNEDGIAELTVVADCLQSDPAHRPNILELAVFLAAYSSFLQENVYK